jgi:hypothetical protein
MPQRSAICAFLAIIWPGGKLSTYQGTIRQLGLGPHNHQVHTYTLVGYVHSMVNGHACSRLRVASSCAVPRGARLSKAESGA